MYGDYYSCLQLLVLFVFCSFYWPEYCDIVMNIGFLCTSGLGLCGSLSKYKLVKTLYTVFTLYATVYQTVKWNMYLRWGDWAYINVCSCYAGKCVFPHNIDSSQGGQIAGDCDTSDTAKMLFYVHINYTR